MEKHRETIGMDCSGGDSDGSEQNDEAWKTEEGRAEKTTSTPTGWSMNRDYKKDGV